MRTIVVNFERPHPDPRQHADVQVRYEPEPDVEPFVMINIGLIGPAGRLEIRDIRILHQILGAVIEDSEERFDEERL